MAIPPATMSTKILIVIFGLAAIPAVSFAQTTGAAGSAGAGNAPTPGTNSLGTAQSSGGAAAGRGSSGAGSTNAAVSAEDKLLDRKLKSICRGC